MTGAVDASPSSTEPGAVTEATRRAFEGRPATYLGALALALAARIDASQDGVGLAALVKEFRSVLAAAMVDLPAVDTVDELRQRREARHRRRITPYDPPKVSGVCKSKGGVTDDDSPGPSDPSPPRTRPPA